MDKVVEDFRSINISFAPNILINYITIECRLLIATSYQAKFFVGHLSNYLI